MGAVVNYQLPTNYGMFISIDSQDELRSYQNTGRLQFGTQGFDNCISTNAYNNTWLAAIGRHNGSLTASELRKNLIVVATGTAGALGGAAMAIGARGASTSPPGTFVLTGQITEIVIWNRALTDDETARYTQYAIAQWNLTP